MLGLHFAVRALKGQVEAALGPQSEVGQIVPGWSAVEVLKVRVPAPRGWPAPDSLRAERIVLVPDLRGLLSGRVRIARITVESGYLSLLRAREGKLRLLPGMLEKPAGAGGGATGPLQGLSIGRIELTDGVVDFFDATVQKPAHRVRLERLRASLENLRVPGYEERMPLRLEGVLKGVKHDGSLSVKGWLEPAARNSELVNTLHKVDLLALQPYLVKASETRVRRGTLDLELKSAVRNNRLHAPGTVTLSDLELGAGGGRWSTFMGVPRQAVVTALKDRNGRIVIPFALDGNLDDPHFSLNDSFTRRLGTSVAESLGIGLERFTHGMGGAAQGLEGVIGRVLGK